MYQQQYSDLPQGAKVLSVPQPSASATYSDLPPGAKVISDPSQINGLPPGAQVVPVGNGDDPYKKYGGSIDDPYKQYGGSISTPLSVDDFAAKIKAKYPAYASMDNLTLARKIVAKYPEYASQVEMPATGDIFDRVAAKQHNAPGGDIFDRVTPAFDVDAARQAGYSDDEILQHLTSTRKFDVNGALNAGYSKQDVINHLAGSSPDTTGIIGPDQTNSAPNDPFANSLSKATSISPQEPGIVPAIKRFGARLEGALGGDKIERGTGSAAVPILGGAALGPVKVAQGLAETPEHPIKGLNDMISGVGQTVALPAAVANPATIAASVPPLLIQHMVQGGLTKLGVDPDVSELVGNAAGIGTGVKTFRNLGAADLTSNAARVTRLRTLLPSALTPDELLTRTLNTGTKGDSAQSLLDLHDDVLSALPRIANAARDSGAIVNSADNMLAAIRQAKNDLLLEHQNALGPGETLADLGPDQRAALHSDMDALNNVQNRVETLQATEDANAAKAAAKGKPVTKSEALNQIARGAGKYAITKAVGGVMPGAGPLSRAAINAAGITSAFSDLSGGLKGLVGKGVAPSALDQSITQVFSHPDMAQLFGPAGDSLVPEPSSVPEIIQRFTGDLLSVPHTSSIAPPEIENGDATLIPQQSGRVPLWQQAGVEASKPSAEIPEPLQPVISARMQQINLAKNLANASPSAADMSGLADSLDGSAPSPIGRRATPVTQRGGITRALTSTPTGEIAPPDNFTYSRSANSGEDAAREFLTSQPLGKLKNLATARNIPFDGREPSQTLAPKLISALTDSLNENELDAFDSARQNAQPNLFPRSRKVAGSTVAASAPAELSGQDLIAGLRQMAEAKKSTVPQPIADAMAATETASPDQIRSLVSGHSSTGNNASLEELSRSGGGLQHWLVDARTGRLKTFLASSPDAGAAGLRPGEAIVSLSKDGTMGVSANSSGLSDTDVMRKIGPTLRREFPEKFKAQGGTKSTSSNVVPEQILRLIPSLSGEASA